MTTYLGMIALSLLISYLMGSVSFAVIVSKAIAHFDVREKGSGNAGMTNVVRTMGWKPGILTFLGDALKGAAAVLLTRYLLLEPAFAAMSEAPSAYWRPEYMAYLCAVFCMLGHVFPVFFQFRGGKAVSTAIGVLSCIHWEGAVLVFVTFLILVLIMRMVSIGSVMGAVQWTFSVLLISAPNGLPLQLYETFLASLITFIVIVKHKDNLRRLHRGEEKTLW